MLNKGFCLLNIRVVSKVAISVFVTFLLISCMNNYTTAYLQTRKNLPQYNKSSYAWYVLKPNDEVNLRVLTIKDDVSSLFLESGSASSGGSSGYRIYPDSTVDFPFMTHLKIGGLTLADATKVVEDKVKELDPKAKVMLALSNDYFYVIGEATHGKYPIYKDKLNIFEALALAGDIQSNGDRGKVRIIRQTSTGVAIKEFDIRTRSIIGSPYYYVYPNDIIYISTSPSSFFHIDSYSAFIGIITTSISFLLLVLNTKH
jgi:polysaccharide export outer membrane protein